MNEDSDFQCLGHHGDKIGFLHMLEQCAQDCRKREKMKSACDSRDFSQQNSRSLARNEEEEEEILLST